MNKAILVSLGMAVFLIFLINAAQLQAQDLGYRQVRRELGLSHEVSLKILEALDNEAELHRGGIMMRETPEAPNQRERLRRQVPAEGYERQALNYLTPAQKKRLDQIQVQSGWPLAFEDFRFAQRVGVTKEQYLKMDSSFRPVTTRWLQETQAFWKANHWWFKLDRKLYARRFATAGAALQRISTRRFEAEQAIVLRSLTPAQMAKWKMLCGKPFRLMDFHSDVKPVPMD